jgi:hypothetical protein
MERKSENSVALYSLWLSITNFEDLVENVSKSLQEVLEVYENSNWKWTVFRYQGAKVTIDSLGFVYIDEASEEDKNAFLLFLAKSINTKTISNIEDTFLNQQIIELPDEKRNLYSSTDRSQNIFNFLDDITVKVEDPRQNIAFDYIITDLLNVQSKDIAPFGLKFSLKEPDKPFHSILNRNFEKLLNKGVYFSQGLTFEEGEIYPLSITKNAEHYIEHLPKLNIEINGKPISDELKNQLCQQLIQKVIQDTLEEHIILNFLRVTKINYLSMIINKIAITNEILKKLNSYLLEDIHRDIVGNTIGDKYLDDESAVEIFIQNLLQTIPRFQMMDIKLREAYYIKVGNTTTNVNIKVDETISSTLFYGKWKSSINFFVDTAVKAKESLDMYHQTKTQKELEDISYNANYQADIEDIREIQKRKDWSLDEQTRKYFNIVVIFLAIITFSAEAPIFTENNPFFENITMLSLQNLMNTVMNIVSYFMITLIVFFVFDYKKFTLIFKWLKRRVFPLWSLIGCQKKSQNVYKVFEFDKADYDKHEHRSTHSFYTVEKQEDGSIQEHKIPIIYNTKISSYTLVKNLKKVSISQIFTNTLCSFDIFPKLLQEVPIGSNQKHEYRENYRISGNDKVATKIMYRYKISCLMLADFLNYLEDDSFIKHYTHYLEGTYNIQEAIKRLRVLSKITPYEDEQEDENGDKKGMELTLYIVYSFVLKFHQMDSRKTHYTYHISKDQFRVHYHISKIYYKNQEQEKKEYETQEQSDFEQTLDDLAILIDIYFLARLKRIE